jgi:hypothetical protein
MRKLGAAVLLIAIPLSRPLGAQTSSVSGITRSATGELAAALFKDMASGLRQLVTAQEMYFTDHNTYGFLLSREDRAAVFILPPPGVTLTLTYATRSAWTARATHEWMLGVSCVIAVGEIPPSRVIRTAAARLAPGAEGVPVCDPPQ